MRRRSSASWPASGRAVAAGRSGDRRPARTARQAGYKIFVLPKLTSIPVFTQNGIGAKLAAKELGDTVTYNGPTDVSGRRAGAVHRHGGAAGLQRHHHLDARRERGRPGAEAGGGEGREGHRPTTATRRPTSRTIFVAPTTNSLIGAAQVEWIGAQIGYKGEIAILSATPTSPNQNTWIKFMKDRAEEAEVQEHEARQDRLRQRRPDRSAQQTQAPSRPTRT